jgi:hypothetical protein
MRPVWKAIFGMLVVASMTLTVAAVPARADSGGGDGGGGLEPSGPGPSITTEAVAQAIRAADDAEDLAKRSRQAIVAADAALKANNKDEAKRQLEKAERLHARSIDAWIAAATAATAADKQLEDAKMIGTTSAELENLRSASADADRQVARAKSAVNQTQGPLDALRSAVK